MLRLFSFRFDTVDLGRAPFDAGRNRWTLFVDASLEALKRYAPAVHWATSFVVALLLLAYTRAVARTSRVAVTGMGWPAAPAVLAMWHGAAPSVLAAVATMSPTPPLTILVATDARGDTQALFCSFLGLRVVRGDARRGARKAMAILFERLRAGECVILAADGGGPAGVIKRGPIALAEATGVPLVPVGGDCYPAVTQPRKWDRARNPVPFGRIAVSSGPPFHANVKNPADLLKLRREISRSLDATVHTAGSFLVSALRSGN